MLGDYYTNIICDIVSVWGTFSTNNTSEVFSAVYTPQVTDSIQNNNDITNQQFSQTFRKSVMKLVLR